MILCVIRAELQFRVMRGELLGQGLAGRIHTRY